MRFTTETRGVLEMLNFIPAYMKRSTYARTILSEPKFLGCMDNQIFTQCDPLRESSAINIHQTMFLRMRPMYIASFHLDFHYKN